MKPGINLSLLIMCLTVYCIRLLPFLVLRKPVRNRFFRSFLYYVPYVTLSVMTFPAIVTATSSPAAGAAALLVGFLLAWIRGDLFTVTIGCCAAAFLVSLMI